MANHIASWLISLQNADGSIQEGHTEGNLDVYAALNGHGDTVQAQKIKNWLESAPGQDWENGPLDIHSWRVLSLGGDYGFTLNNTQEHKRASTCACSQQTTLGFVAAPDRQDNIWVEGTGGMILAFYKAGYDAAGDFYLNKIKKCIFCSKGPKAQTLPFLGISDPGDIWADPYKGHVASVCWYFFALNRFNPFDGLIMGSVPRQNPIVRVQAENYDSLTGEARFDGAGCPLEGGAIHIAGDDNISCPYTTCQNAARYTFYLLETINNANISVKYADDVGGDNCNIYIIC